MTPGGLRQAVDTLRRVRRPLRVALLTALAAVVVAGCGGGGDKDEDGKKKPAEKGASFNAAIRQAQDVEAKDFPAVSGRTLEEIANTLPPVNLGLATSVFTPGKNRLAFGVIDEARAFVYGKTAIYVARNPKSGPALGPFPAPADPLLVAPPFRSRGAAQASGDIAAIYEAQIDLPSPGKYFVLSLSKAQGKLFGAASQIEAKRSSPIPDIGERPPAIKTETRASAGGDIASIDTRVPPDDMHDAEFSKVIGKKPVALVFATPQLCQTRVCGPVTDIAAQLKAEYGDRMEFIHQEVYVDNDIKKGLRPPLEAFKLQTEPWLFTFDRNGKVAARVEGSFGNGGFERAIKAAL